MQRSAEISESRIKKIWCIRHCKSGWNLKDIPKGPLDNSLNEIGKQQAKVTALFVKKLVLNDSNTKMVCSPLKRAVETAQAIEEETGVQINAKIDGLKARYYGDFRLVNDLSQIPPDAENQIDFEKRIHETFYSILDEYDQTNNLIIVSHNEVFKYLAEILTGKKNQRLLEGGISCCMVNKNGSWSIKIFNIKHFESDEKAIGRSTLQMNSMFLHNNSISSLPKLPMKRSQSCCW